MVAFIVSSGRGMQQIGQSPICVLSGCLNSSSSRRNSADLFLHSVLCSFQWSFWHSTPQYLTRWQAVHFLNLMSSLSGMPQDAQRLISSSASLLSSVLMMYVLFAPILSSLSIHPNNSLRHQLCQITVVMTAMHWLWLRFSWCQSCTIVCGHRDDDVVRAFLRESSGKSGL